MNGLSPLEVSRLDPRIGMLNGGDFYAFAHGYDKPETRGTLEQVEIALGIRKSVPPAPAKPLRRFLVTVTPKFVVYSGTWVMGEYTVTVTAKTRGEAIKKTRREREDNEGLHAVPASYKARLAKDGE